MVHHRCCSWWVCSPSNTLLVLWVLCSCVGPHLVRWSNEHDVIALIDSCCCCSCTPISTQSDVCAEPVVLGRNPDAPLISNSVNTMHTCADLCINHISVCSVCHLLSHSIHTYIIHHNLLYVKSRNLHRLGLHMWMRSGGHTSTLDQGNCESDHALGRCMHGTSRATMPVTLGIAVTHTCTRPCDDERQFCPALSICLSVCLALCNVCAPVCWAQKSPRSNERSGAASY